MRWEVPSPTTSVAQSAEELDQIEAIDRLLRLAEPLPHPELAVAYHLLVRLARLEWPAIQVWIDRVETAAVDLVGAFTWKTPKIFGFNHRATP